MSDFLLELNDVQAGYGRAAMVLRGLTVKVPPGTVVCLVGPNGAGKSTVLKVASGMLTPRSGSVVVDGVDVTGQGPQQMLRSGLAHVLQGHSVFKEMTVGENVLLGAYTVPDKDLVKERSDFVTSLFPVVGERWNALAGALSGGQQKQVEFARSLMVSPKVVLLDEPSMGLDPKTTGTVFQQVARMRDAGIAVLLVEQNARARCRPPTSAASWTSAVCTSRARPPTFSPTRSWPRSTWVAAPTLLPRTRQADLRCRQRRTACS